MTTRIRPVDTSMLRDNITTGNWMASVSVGAATLLTRNHVLLAGTTVTVAVTLVFSLFSFAAPHNDSVRVLTRDALFSVLIGGGATAVIAGHGNYTWWAVTGLWALLISATCVMVPITRKRRDGAVLTEPGISPRR